MLAFVLHELHAWLVSCSTETNLVVVLELVGVIELVIRGIVLVTRDIELVLHLVSHGLKDFSYLLLVIYEPIGINLLMHHVLVEGCKELSVDLIEV